MNNHNTETRDSWDRRYLRLARMVAGWSKDPSTQCGAVLVRPDNTLSSVGYNGFPRGADDRPALYADRAAKYPRIIHSEWNAISNTHDPDLTGYTVYAWPMPPCNQCTGALIQKKIGRYVQPTPTADKLERWGKAFDFARGMLEQKQARVDYIELEDETMGWTPNFDAATNIWARRFLLMAREICSWSKDHLDPHGAVVVRADKTIASIGFSGLPQGVDDSPLENDDQDARDIMRISAERNAMLFSKDPTHEGHAAYLWPGPPNLDAISHLVHQGIRTIVYPLRAGQADMTPEARGWLEEMSGKAIAVKWSQLVGSP